MKKQTILFIITQSEWGGAQKYVYDIATRLPKDRYIPFVAMGKSDSYELRNKLTAKKIKTFTAPHLGREIHPLNDIRSIFELTRIIKRLKPNIVHLNSSKVSIVGSIASWLTHVPITIYTVHGWVFNEPNSWWKNAIYRFLETATAFMKTTVICVSENDRRIAMEKHIVKNKKLVTIYNGINEKELEFYEQGVARELLSQKTGIAFPSDKILVGTVANLYKTKGIEYLIKAAAHLPQMLFIVIGEGPERINLEKEMEKNKVYERFFLPGAIKNAYQYLKAFDIFTLPSVKEGFPFIILEALAAKIPIIATRVGGMPEVLPEKNLIVKENADALKKALVNPPQIPSISLATSLATTVKKTIEVYERPSYDSGDGRISVR